jgi:hypothetical protein
MGKWQFPELLEQSLCPRVPPISILTLRPYNRIQSRFSRVSRITQNLFTGCKKLALLKLSPQSAKYWLQVVQKNVQGINMKIPPLIGSSNVSETRFQLPT